MNKLITMTVAIVVAVILTMGILIPTIDDGTSTTTEVTNEGAGWLRFDLNSDANAEYEVHVVIDEGADTFSVVNGTDTQTYTGDGTDFESILYADTNLSVWADDSAIHILGISNGSPFYIDGWGDLDIIRTSEGVSVGYGGDAVSFATPSWAYVPRSTGSYGFFGNGTETEPYPENMPIAAVGGGFAGVYAYNDIYRYDGLGLTMTVTQSDGKIFGASWARATENADEEQPLGMIVLPTKTEPTKQTVEHDNNSKGLMAEPPTPTYSDGDWGYDLVNVGGVQKAKIVSYSGASVDTLTIPSIVGGYDVYQIGRGTTNLNKPILPSTISVNDVIIPEGVVVIAQYAFFQCNSITGTVVIPNTVTEIQNYAFYQCTNLTGPVVVPDSVITFGSGIFYGCSSLTGSVVIPGGMVDIPETYYLSCSSLTGSVVIPDTVTSIGHSAFSNCRGLTGSVVIPDTVTSIANSAFSNDTGITSLIVASDATPGTSTFNNTPNISMILDLSDTVDYSTKPGGLPAGATVSDSIGDCMGYMSIARYYEKETINSPIVPLLFTIPIVVLAGIAIGAVTMIRSKD